MTSFKYIAAVLALVGAVGSAQAASEVQNDQVQFMADHELHEVVGAKFDGFTLGDTYRVLNELISMFGYKSSQITENEKSNIRKGLKLRHNSGIVYSEQQIFTYLTGKVHSCAQTRC